MSLPKVKGDMLRMQGPRIIFDEVMRMLAADKGYTGVSFECGNNPDSRVSVCYELGRGASMGQPQEYEKALWKEICLAMRLVGVTAHCHGFYELIRLAEGIGFNASRWTVRPGTIKEDSLLVLGVLLFRVDRAIACLFDTRLDVLDGVGA